MARKELRDEIASLRKNTAGQRSEISSLKKQLHALQAEVKRLSRDHVAKSAAGRTKKETFLDASSDVKPGRKASFSGDRLKQQRTRLGFTQEQMAKLLGVSSLSVWKWETGAAIPRASRVPLILQKLSLGKREALALVEAAGS